ncbi:MULTISPECIES: hypothetical protein [unclassified Lentimicrobium]|uniref:hypothetical protein n=1 Tax=unclassified Lentimicrobium TaxID=2677434 RepID=UPI0015553D4D|nr:MULTISPECIES: hypothetical protein [unclassified Lentimicrobium]NPD46415.1 hypothetical protein [Lentimicrobium sp. S6]NPD84944.1 hypothetical protein [Lentimicrobium sp. L6]
MKITIYIAILASLISSNLFAQNTEHNHTHSHHKNELGIANSLVYFTNAEELAYGLHLHYIRSLPHSKFGLGLGYERVFDEHGHNTFGIVGGYSPMERLHLAVSPGITFEDGSSEVNFAFHFETSYGFEIYDFHLGPLLEFAFDPEDIHISLGIHVGYGI